MIFQTPPKKNSYGLVDMETLFIYPDGRIRCTCENQLFNKDREIISNCEHTFWFLNNFENLEKSGWKEITP